MNREYYDAEIFFPPYWEAYDVDRWLFMYDLWHHLRFVSIRNKGQYSELVKFRSKDICMYVDYPYRQP